CPGPRRLAARGGRRLRRQSRACDALLAHPAAGNAPPTRGITGQGRAASPLHVPAAWALCGWPEGAGGAPTACAVAWVARRGVMDRFAHTDATSLIADSLLGALPCVRQALAAAGCARIDTSGDEAEALALIARERMDPVLVAWEAFHDGLELWHAL